MVAGTAADAERWTGYFSYFDRTGTRHNRAQGINIPL